MAAWQKGWGPPASKPMEAEVLEASHLVCEPWIPRWEEVEDPSAEVSG